MRRALFVILGIGLIGVIAARASLRRAPREQRGGAAATFTRTRPSTPARRSFEAGLDRLAAALRGLNATWSGSPPERRAAFRAARRAYKESECLLAVFGPTLATG